MVVILVLENNISFHLTLFNISVGVTLRVCVSEGEKKGSHSMDLIKEGVKTASWSTERKTPHMWAASHR